MAGALTLEDLEPGQKARVLKVRASSPTTHRRLLEMGVVRGAVVEMERSAPLGDPVEIELKGYHLSLRREEARGIAVEPIGEEEQ